MAVSATAGVLLCEILLRTFHPQNVMYPRYMFSREYGLLPFADCVMVHQKKGSYDYRYTINRKHHRGALLPFSNAYKKKRIVVLGDSCSFGQGVNDGEEYPAALGRILEADYSVANLSAPGWGLTQEIRRFYELGQLYSPGIVVLQFCDNDVNDNMLNGVTVIEDGRFVFRDSANTMNWIKKYLSASPIQRSHLYNLVRNDLYQLFAKRSVKRSGRADNELRAGERFYVELLSLFAKDLHAKGRRLLMIDTDNDLRDFALVKSAVTALEQEGLVDYCDTELWLKGMTDHQSPEGHVWGQKAHAVIAQKLAVHIQEKDQP